MKNFALFLKVGLSANYKDKLPIIKYQNVKIKEKELVQKRQFFFLRNKSNN
jgi:hypothetical protein